MLACNATKSNFPRNYSRSDELFLLKAGGKEATAVVAVASGSGLNAFLLKAPLVTARSIFPSLQRWSVWAA